MSKEESNNVTQLPINHEPEDRDELSIFAFGDPMHPDFIEFMVDAANSFEKYKELAPDPRMMSAISQQINKTLDYFRHLEKMECDED